MPRQGLLVDGKAQGSHPVFLSHGTWHVYATANSRAQLALRGSTALPVCCSITILTSLAFQLGSHGKALCPGLPARRHCDSSVMNEGMLGLERIAVAPKLRLAS